MLLFAREFGWRIPPVYLSRNTSDRKLSLDFTPAQIAKLERLNALDIELYDLAKRRFRERLEHEGWLEKDRKRFERWQKFARHLLQIHRRLRSH